MSNINLVITKEYYGVCGDCMFLYPSLFEIKKHGSSDIRCALFNETLTMENGVVNSCDTCDNCDRK